MGSNGRTALLAVISAVMLLLVCSLCSKGPRGRSNGGEVNYLDSSGKPAAGPISGGSRAARRTITPNQEQVINEFVSKDAFKFHHESGYSECQVRPWVWNASDFDQKRDLVAVVGLYCERNNPGVDVVVLRDRMTGAELGTYSAHSQTVRKP